MYRTKKILVTGAYGFLGKFFCKELEDRGYTDIIRLAGPSSADIDLTKISDVEHVFDIYTPDVVVHLAARVGGIGANKNYPGSFFYQNMAMGLNVIEQARKSNCEKFVLASTVCAYPKFTPVPFNEMDIWNGYPEETNAPYGIAKKTLMEMLQAYHNQFGMNTVNLIPTNMYGPGDNYDPRASHVIPAIMSRVAYAKENDEPELEVWGSGEASREFLFVEDCAEAIQLALENHDNDPSPINIGTGEETKIKDMVEMMCDIMGYNGELRWNDRRPDGQPRRSLDVTRAKEKLGFTATTSLRQGLEKTVQWFNHFMTPYKKPLKSLPPTERS